MKNVYRVSFMDGDEPRFINVLADSEAKAVLHAGSPTTGLQVVIAVSGVEVAGVDAAHVAPKTPATIVIGPPQNVPLTQFEVDQLRKSIGGSGPITQADTDKLRKLGQQ